MDNPFSTTGLRHGKDDPRGLLERIEAQLGERIDEAVEMAALSLLVELRAKHNRPAPENDSRADRDEFQALARDLLGYLREALAAKIPEEQRAGMAQAEGREGDERTRALRGHVFLARQLPDYWQRFEAHRADHAAVRLAAPPPKLGLFKGLLG